MNGKGKCKILKDIRRQIAQCNEIEYVTSECKYQGNCSGTCPKCEQEVRYLERQLQKRWQAGKVVTVAGVAAALVVGMSGCALEFGNEKGGKVPLPTEQVELDGQAPDPTETAALMGEVPDPTYETSELILMGDVAYPPDSQESDPR